MTLKGIDISNWQSGLNLSRINCDFVILKATEGANFVDRSFQRFYTEARRLEKKSGIYHFARPGKNAPEKEAEAFLAVSRPYVGEAILILDWEAYPLGDTTWAKTWLEYVYQKTGVKPMIYMSESVANSYNWSAIANQNYGLWVAKYRDNKIDYNYDMSGAGSAPRVKWWPVYAMWQWTSTGRLDGYGGNLDCDIFYGDGRAWDAYAGKKSTQSHQNAPESIEISHYM